MLSQSLEKMLNNMFQKRRSQGAEFIGVEDILRGLLDDSKCRELLVDLGANAEKVERALDAHIESQIPHATACPNENVQPTLGFQRVLQRAVFHVQSSGKKEVSSMNILVSLVSERESAAAKLLAEQGIERKDLLHRLGTSDWDEGSANVSITDGPTSESVSASSFAVAASQSSIEKRLDELEEKLDIAIGEIRQLSATMRQLLERPPPNA